MVFYILFHRIYFLSKKKSVGYNKKRQGVASTFRLPRTRGRYKYRGCIGAYANNDAGKQRLAS